MTSQPKAKSSELRIEYVPLDDLKRWPNNPKKHHIQTIAGSMERFGFTNPIIVDETTGKIVAGHGRLTVLENKRKIGAPPPARVRVEPDGTWSVPVVRGIALAEEGEAQAYVIADNRTVELGGWDDPMLAEILADLAGREKLNGTGFSRGEVDRMLERQNRVTPPKPEVEFAEELMEHHDYVVLYFDNEVDWQQAKTLFGLTTVKNKNACLRKRGIGRVLRGAEALERLRKEFAG